MKLLLLATVALGSSCTQEQLVTSTAESMEIGICGANLDPLPGVTCHYAYSAVPGTEWVYSHATPFEDDQGLDWVRCFYTAPCKGQGFAWAADTKHEDWPTPCHHVLGTGCSEEVTATAETSWTAKLPLGTLVDDLDAFCGSLNTSSIFESPAGACRLHDWTSVEQYEDICCAERTPLPGGGSGGGSGSGGDGSGSGGGGSGSGGGGSGSGSGGSGSG